MQFCSLYSVFCKSSPAFALRPNGCNPRRLLTSTVVFFFSVFRGFTSKRHLHFTVFQDWQITERLLSSFCFYLFSFHSKPTPQTTSSCFLLQEYISVVSPYCFHLQVFLFFNWSVGWLVLWNRWSDIKQISTTFDISFHCRFGKGLT